MMEGAVVVKANPARKVFRPQGKALNKVPDEILNDARLNQAIESLPSNYNFEVHKTIWRVRREGCRRVGLQMPEGLLMFSIRLCEIIETFTEADTVILGDVTYGACCVDDFTASALGVDLLVHYGHSCLVPIDQTSSLKTLYVFVDIKIDSVHFLETLKANFTQESKLALVSTIQFLTTLHGVANELRKSNYSVSVPQSKPLSPGEILGCTAPTLKDADTLVYLGDGRFHLEAAMIANPGLKAFRYDPYEKNITEEFYDLQLMKTLRQDAISKTSSAQRIGIVLGTLGRQGSPNVLKHLEGYVKKKEKKCVVVLLSEIFPKKLSLFDWVEAWVQVACPRLSIDWGSQFPSPLLSPYEGAVALGQKDWQDDYPMDYYSSDPLGPWTPNFKSECCGKSCKK